jgi:hypothetical protein
MPGVLAQAVAGPLLVAAGVLAVAGAAKLREPDATARALTAIGLRGRDELARALGAGEVALAAACIAWPGRPVAIAVGVVYACFAAFVAAAMAGVVRTATCGCFGSRETEPGLVHLGFTVGAAAAAALAAAAPPPPLWQLLPDQPLAGVPFALGALACVGCAVLALTALPPLLASYGGRRG